MQKARFSSMGSLAPITVSREACRVNSLAAAWPTWNRLFHAPSLRNCMEPAACDPQIPSALAMVAASSPRIRPAAAAAPKVPQVAVGWKPRS